MQDVNGQIINEKDIIIDNSGKGFVVKDSDGHYWRINVSLLGILNTTDLGTDKPEP